MLKTPILALLCVITASVLGALGQYLFKAGASHKGDHPASFLLSPWVWIGMTCYVAVMFLFTYAFRKGGTVTVLYPLYATTFIWAALIAQIWFDQPIRLVHIVGMVCLLAGIYLMGIGNAAPP